MRKIIFTLPIFPACVILISPTATWAARSCMDLASCRDLLVAGNCCCPTGLTGTIVKCPDGWSAGTIGNTCKRGSTTATDAKGTYTQEYGTCSGTGTTGPCYMMALSDDGTGNCYCTMGV